MSFAAYREALGLTLEQCALALDLSPNSKGHLSRIENGARAAIPLALKIEAWSGGEVQAASLVTPEDAHLLAAHARFSTPANAEVSA